MKKNRIIIAFLLLFCLVFTNEGTVFAADTQDNEMTIYALYLGQNTKGDSTLITSKKEALLIDIGSPTQVTNVIKQCEKADIKKVDILFSHLHMDHMGGTDELPLGGVFQIINSGIEIRRIYVPSPSISPQSQMFDRRLSQLIQFCAKRKGCKLFFLNVGYQITVGDVVGTVIGPLHTGRLNRQEYIRKSDYENNCSLAMIFSCGNTRFFTAGDCFKDSADELVDAYGPILNCDIMKLSHHGTGDGNTEELIDYISPLYSFTPNTGIGGINDETKKYYVYPANNYASKHGLCYQIGDEKKTLILQVKNDKISLYKGSTVSSKTKLTGWQSFYGGDGKKTKKRTYYINKDGVPFTGIAALEEINKQTDTH